MFHPKYPLVLQTQKKVALCEFSALCVRILCDMHFL